LRDWGNGQAFRLADALTGVCVFGATGSGKTSGPAKQLSIVSTAPQSLAQIADANWQASSFVVFIPPAPAPLDAPAARVWIDS